MSKIMELQAELLTAVTAQRTLVDKAHAEKRGFTPEEKVSLDKMDNHIDALEGRIAAEQKLSKREAGYSQSTSKTQRDSDSGGYYPSREGEVRLYRHDEPLPQRSGLLPDGIHPGELSLGRAIRGIVLGDWTGAEAERRVMSGSSDTLGGYMVPEALSMNVIDLARNESVVLQAGALTAEMTTSTLKMAKITKDPTGYWRAENAAITESDMTFGMVTLTSKALGALCRVSIELLEDAANAGAVIQDALGKALAVELDRVALVGSGTGVEPLGIFGHTSPGNAVGVVSMGDNGAALTSYAPFSQAMQKVYEANGKPTAVIYAPRTWGALDQLTDQNDQPLNPPASFKGLGQFISNQVPIDQTQGNVSTASSAFLGGFENVIIGMRTNLVLEASRVAESDAFSKMQVMIRGYIRADVQLARASQLSVIKGIIPAG